MAKGDDIAGYTWKAENLCLSCITDQLSPCPQGNTNEEKLDYLAEFFGVNRNDETSFDSEDFPKPIFISELDTENECSRCGAELLDMKGL